MEHGRKGIQTKAVRTLWDRPMVAVEMDGHGMERLSWQEGRDRYQYLQSQCQT